MESDVKARVRKLTEFKTDVPQPTFSVSPTLPALPADAGLWTGTGLCCEAQGDGVPCRGVDGECESCGRALPIPAVESDRPGN